MRKAAGLMNSVSRDKAAAVTPEKTCLHLVLRASGEVLDDCLACSGKGDSIVLLDTAVTLLALPGAGRWSSTGGTLYFLEADLLAHGLGQLAGNPGLVRLDDMGLVQLVCRHDHCLSWK